MNLPVVSVPDMQLMARAVAASGLYGIKTVDQAFSLMCIAQAENRHPGCVARDYHIIQNKPALKADTMLARFQEAGGKVNWLVYTNKEVKGKFSHQSGGELELSWTIQDAEKAKLTSNPTWNKYPRAMLRARVISEAIRTVFPGVMTGFYTPEEIEDLDATPKDPIKTDCEVVDESPEKHQTQAEQINKDKLREQTKIYIDSRISQCETLEQWESVHKDLKAQTWWGSVGEEIFQEKYQAFEHALACMDESEEPLTNY